MNNKIFLTNSNKVVVVEGNVDITIQGATLVEENIAENEINTFKANSDKLHSIVNGRLQEKKEDKKIKIINKNKESS